MMRHVGKLIWNRKRQNLLLLVELIGAFLVVVVLGVMAVQVAHNVRQPLGFSAERVWSIRLSRGRDILAEERDPNVERRRYSLLLTAAHDLPQIEAASLTWTGPFEQYNWDQRLRLLDQRVISYGTNRSDDEFANTISMPVIEGRWFNREDDGVEWEPVVINAQLAREVYAESNPIGTFLPEEPEDSQFRAPGAPPPRRKKVVGVVEDFRQFGELSTLTPYLFLRQSLDDPRATQLPELLLVRVRPGTTAAFEETLVRRLEAVAPGWSFNVSTVEALREDMRTLYLVPLAVLGTVAAALLLMTALGLTGVVWQNVTQRTREFGLRRANGATARHVSRQVLGELLALTTAAVVIGGLLVLQVVFLPLPPALAVVPQRVFLTGVGLAAAAVYLVTLLSGWYPARLAARVPPAEALHYE